MDDVPSAGRRGSVHCGGQRYLPYCLANEDPWRTVLHITVPGVNDVLADVVQQDVNRQSTSLGRVAQGVEGKQGVFLHPSK